MDANKIVSDMALFTGTEHYYQHSQQLVLTDGTKYLAYAAQCCWLFDVISSYLPSMPSDEDFAVVRLTVKDNQAEFEVVDDVPARRYYATQSIEYTDFPLQQFKCYIARIEDRVWCAMLTSEY